jgi:hypothetical protein
MITIVNGKRIAFGLQWKSSLSEGDLHREARAAKARFFWNAEKAVYYGLMSEADSKLKPKGPIYSGAIALLHRFPDVPNFVMVLVVPEGSPELPKGGFIVCGIHHSRPRADFDTVVETQDEVTSLLKKFQHLCQSESFTLYGNARIGGIEAASMEDVLKGIDPTAAMRKTKSAVVNPLVFVGAAAVIIGATSYGYKAYSDHKKAEAQRLAAASQKNSQQLYDEEIAARRKDGVILARDVPAALSEVRSMDFTIRGWALEKVTCNFPPEKQMVCMVEYKLRQGSKGTYETFVAAAPGLENLEFVGEKIKGTKVIKTAPFVDLGKAIDSARPQRDEVIEFASGLQRIRHLGEPKLMQFEPFGVPPGASVGELTTPPLTSASWTFGGPARNAKHLVTFPEYAIVSQFVMTFNDQPRYEAKQSIAMLTVQGKIYSKPN